MGNHSHRQETGANSQIAGFELVSVDPHGIEGFAAGADGVFLPCAISISSSGNPCVLRIHGMFNFYTEPFLKQRIRKAVQTLDVQDLIIDLSYCETIDATGLALLIRTDRDLKGAGCQLRLSHPSPRVLRILDITRVGEMLNLVR